MVCEPDEDLLKTAHASLARRQISTDFLQSIAKQRMPAERPSKVATGVLFSCHVARLAKLVSNWKILWSHVTPMPNCMVLMETIFKCETFMALSHPKKFPTPVLHVYFL